ncbi:MAG: DUF3164 family protein [Thalassobaculaceae bacterium]
MTDTMLAEPAVPAGYLKDAKGRLVPATMVKDHEKLEDDVVHKVLAYADDLSAQIARFKGHTFEDVATFLDLLAEKYNARKRGLDGKGNVTLSTYDGRQRIKIQVHDTLTFGPGLQIAKSKIDDCLRAWSADAGPELRAIVTEAFRTDKEGQVSREALFSLLRMEIEDAGWNEAMQALRDSIRVEGSKTYIRLQRRGDDGAWKTLSIDLASAVVPEGMTASHVPATD